MNRPRGFFTGGFFTGFAAAVFASLFVALPFRAAAQQITPQRLTATANEPQNWLMYSGNYYSNRYSPLT